MEDCDGQRCQSPKNEDLKLRNLFLSFQKQSSIQITINHQMRSNHFLIEFRVTDLEFNISYKLSVVQRSLSMNFELLTLIFNQSIKP